MPRSTRPNSLATGFFVLLVIAGGLYAANRGVLSSNQGGGPIDELPAGIEAKPTIVEKNDADTSAELPGIVVGVSKGKTFSAIQRPATGDEKTYFTDADPSRLGGQSEAGEQSKIQQSLGTDFKSLLYVWTSKNPAGASGQVATITTDGSGKLALLGEELTTTSAPAVNPSGSQVATIGFDNSEGNFGFTLITQKVSGGDLKLADSSSDGIALPRWSQNDSLAYVVGQATPDKGQELRVRIGDKSTTRFTSEKNQLISDLVWLGNNRLAVVVEPLGNNTANKAKIIILKSDSGDVDKTIDKPGKERSLAATSNGTILGFIAGDVSGLSTQSGTVTLVDIANGIEATRGDATSIVGFLQ